MKSYGPARGMKRRHFLLTAGGFTTALVLPSCTSSSQNPVPGSSGTPSLSLKVGVSPVPHGEILTYVKDQLAAKAGLTIEIVEFSDYVQPNLALNDRQIDANYFQHVPYMEDFGKERNIDMVAVVPVHIEPLGLYSRRLKRLEDVTDGASIAVPNDATNLGRSLNLLAAQGLLSLKAGVGTQATVKDIEQNTKNLKFNELEAAQLPRSLDDVDLAVINGNYAIQIGLTPSKDALVLESATNNPYANVLAVLRGRENEPAVQALAKLLTSADVKQFIQDKYQGSVIPVA